MRIIQDLGEQEENNSSDPLHALDGLFRKFILENSVEVSDEEIQDACACPEEDNLNEDFINGFEIGFITCFEYLKSKL